MCYYFENSEIYKSLWVIIIIRYIYEPLYSTGLHVLALNFYRGNKYSRHVQRHVSSDCTKYYWPWAKSAAIIIIHNGIVLFYLKFLHSFSSLVFYVFVTISNFTSSSLIYYKTKYCFDFIYFLNYNICFCNKSHHWLKCVYGICRVGLLYC